jgi:hypothetical protein
VDTVGKRTGEVCGDPDRKAGLTDAAGTGQGDQPDIMSLEQFTDTIQFLRAPDERRKGNRKSMYVLVGQSGGHDAGALGFPIIAGAIVRNVAEISIATAAWSRIDLSHAAPISVATTISELTVPPVALDCWLAPS